MAPYSMARPRAFRGGADRSVGAGPVEGGQKQHPALFLPLPAGRLEDFAATPVPPVARLPEAPGGVPLACLEKCVERLRRLRPILPLHRETPRDRLLQTGRDAMRTLLREGRGRALPLALEHLDRGPSRKRG